MNLWSLKETVKIMSEVKYREEKCINYLFMAKILSDMFYCRSIPQSSLICFMDPSTNCFIWQKNLITKCNKNPFFSFTQRPFEWIITAVYPMISRFYIHFLLTCLYIYKQEEKQYVLGLGLTEDWWKASIAENKLLENLN